MLRARNIFITDINDVIYRRYGAIGLIGVIDIIGVINVIGVVDVIGVIGVMASVGCLVPRRLFVKKQ
jgi:hypothetical protein